MGLNYILQIVPIVANDTVDSTNDVNCCRKTFRLMLLPLVLHVLANNDCEIDRTLSSSYFNRVNHN